MKPSISFAALMMIGTLVGLSGCVWPDGGGYDRGGGGDHSQRLGGDDRGDRGDHGRGCDDQHRDDCRDR